MTKKDAKRIVAAIYKADSGLDSVVDTLNEHCPGPDWSALWKDHQDKETAEYRKWLAAQPPFTLEELQRKMDQSKAALLDQLTRSVFEPSATWTTLVCHRPCHGG